MAAAVPSRLVVPVVLAALVALAGVQLQAQQPPQEFKPTIGQPGKDVIWVPTPDELVETMLNLAKITPKDYVIDLGSGDGRNVIAAAKRGARALGVEFNKDLVEFSKRAATAAGVADRARFVEGDMFEADISRADVLALFLLPMQMAELSPKFLNLKAGSRIVSNTFGIEGWEPDVTERMVGEWSSRSRSRFRWCPARSEPAARSFPSKGSCAVKRLPSPPAASRMRVAFAAARSTARLNRAVPAPGARVVSGAEAHQPLKRRQSTPYFRTR